MIKFTATSFSPAGYGHMGREDLGVSWEKTDMAGALKAAVEAL